MSQTQMLDKVPTDLVNNRGDHTFFRYNYIELSESDVFSSYKIR